MNYSIRTASSIIFFTCISIFINAQEVNTPAAYELKSTENLWRQTNNAAGSLIDNSYNYTIVNSSYDFYNGNFHRPQQGESGKDFNFNSEGAILLDKFYVWGSFNYTQNNIKDANYNASIIDPYRGMPYIVADTNKSDWRNQHYDLRFRVATFPHKKVAFGIEGIYKASIGAKQRDIRTENLFYLLNLKPGIVYSFDKKHHLGLNGEYYSIKEESNMSNVNTYIDQQYYELYGLGTSVQGIGSGRTTNYVGSSFGGSLQYNYRGPINLLFESSYSKKNETVEIGFSRPRKDASVADEILNAKLIMFKKEQDYTNRISLNLTNRKINGTQYVTKYDNSISQLGWIVMSSAVRSTFTNTTLIADYTLIANEGLEYNWVIGMRGKYEAEDDVYLLPKSNKNAANVTTNIYGKKSFKISDKLLKRFLVGVDLSYNKNLSGEYQYSGQHADYLIVTDFEKTDLNYLIANYYSAGISACYSQKLDEAKKANLFIKADFNYTYTSDFDFNNRRLAQISFGFNF